jgi:hypothetical protein
MDTFEMKSEAQARRHRALTTIVTVADNLLDLQDRAPAIADDLETPRCTDRWGRDRCGT